MKLFKISDVLLSLMFVIGLSLLLYPSVSNYWNSFRQTKAVASYENEVANLDKDKYQEIWDNAIHFNQKLVEKGPFSKLSVSEEQEYNTLLNVDGTSMMGFVSIPSINVYLPIYHGVSDEVLQVSIGHLNWSSLPTGGESTHCVVSGHRGLPSAKLFTDLNKLIEGDVFSIHVLDKVFTYEVDQILIVEPYETNDLKIVKGEDYVTLVTCTPYGVNSHRMLVRGKRNEALAENNVRVPADASKVKPIVVAIVLSAPILLLAFVVALFPRKKRKPITYEDLFS